MSLPVNNSGLSARFRDIAISEKIFDVTLDPMIIISADGVIERFNPAAEKIFGYSAEEIIGKNVNHLMPQPHRDNHDGYLSSYLAGGEKKIIGIGREVEAMRKDGSLFPANLAIGEIKMDDEIVFVGTLHDLTRRKDQEEKLIHYIQDLEMSRSSIEKQASDMAGLAEQVHLEKEKVEESKRIIEHQATHDTLTDLGNRGLLNKCLPAMLKEAAEQNRKVGFIYIDLDNFKPVNDRLGHDAGDKLLCQVADALRNFMGEKDEVIRLGGDEFAFLACLDKGHDREELKALALRILAALDIPVKGPDFVIETGASIGIALYPDDGGDMGSILKAGDTAMYKAKKAGKGQVY